MSNLSDVQPMQNPIESAHVIPFSVIHRGQQRVARTGFVVEYAPIPVTEPLSLAYSFVYLHVSPERGIVKTATLDEATVYSDREALEAYMKGNDYVTPPAHHEPGIVREMTEYIVRSVKQPGAYKSLSAAMRDRLAKLQKTHPLEGIMQNDEVHGKDGPQAPPNS